MIAGAVVNATAGRPVLNRPGWLNLAAVECPSISAAANIVTRAGNGGIAVNIAKLRLVKGQRGLHCNGDFRPLAPSVNSKSRNF
jgi:hypothetical protein